MPIRPSVLLGLCALLVPAALAAAPTHEGGAAPADPAPPGRPDTTPTRAELRARSLQALTQDWRWRQLRREGSASTFGFVGALPGDRLVAADADGLWIHDGRTWTAVCTLGNAAQHRVVAVEELPWGLVVITRTRILSVEPRDGGGYAEPTPLFGAQPGTPTRMGRPVRLDADTLLVPIDGALHEVRRHGLGPRDGPPTRTDGGVEAVVATPDGRLVAQSAERTWIGDAGSWAAHALPSDEPLPAPSHAVTLDDAAIVLDRFPCYWPGVRIDARGVSALPLVPDNGHLSAAAVSPAGQLLIASRSGRMHALTDDGWQRVPAPAGVEGQIVSLTWSASDRVALVDGTGKLWAADVASRHWTHVATAPAMGPAVNALAFARTGGVWLAGQGVARYADGAFVEVIDPADVPGTDLAAVTCVLESEGGTLWLGSGGYMGGVARREDGRWRVDTDPRGPGEFGVHSVREAPDGSLWFALLSRDDDDYMRGGVAIHDERGWRRLPDPPGGMPRTYGVTWAPDGTAFVGTTDGVLSWDGRTWTLLDDGTPASRHKAFAVHHDRQGRVWTAAGPYLRGVQSWDPRTNRWTVREEGHWRIAAAGSFAEDAHGRLWMASEAGLFVAQGEDCFRVSTEGVSDTSVFWPLLAAERGRALWIGSLNGSLLRLALHDDAAPRTTISDVTTRDDLPQQVLVARWHASDVWRETRDEHLRYQWRLDDGPWSPVQRERHARFRDLSWGEHELQVRALDVAGNQEDPPARMLFTVPTPAWAGPWTLVPAAALVLSLAVLGLTSMRRHAERRAAERRHAQLSQRLSMLTRRLLDDQEAERRWLSRDLQERLGQALAATTLQLELAARSDEPERRAEALERGAQTVREVLAAVRALASDVAPPLFNDFGLEAAVRELAGEFEQRTGISPELTLALEHPVAARVAGQAHRILQQALDNVARHAAAGTVRLSVSSSPEALRAVLSDDGRGFLPSDLEPDQGLGLLDMRERAECLGGHVTVDSAYHDGTTVRLTIPLESFAPSPGRFPPWLRSASSSPTITAWSSTDSPPSSRNTPTST